MSLLEWFWVHPDVSKEYYREDNTAAKNRLGFAWVLNGLFTALWAILHAALWLGVGHTPVWLSGATPAVLAVGLLIVLAINARHAREYAQVRNIELRRVDTYRALARLWTDRRRWAVWFVMAGPLAAALAWWGHIGSAWAVVLGTMWAVERVFDNYLDREAEDRGHYKCRTDITNIELVRWHRAERAKADKANDDLMSECLDEAYSEVFGLCGQDKPLERRIEELPAEPSATSSPASTDDARAQKAKIEEEQARQQRDAEENALAGAVAQELLHMAHVMARACESACISRAETPGMSLLVAGQMILALQDPTKREVVLRCAIERAADTSKSFHRVLGEPQMRKTFALRGEGDSVEHHATFDVDINDYIVAILAVMAERVTPTYLQPPSTKGFRLIPTKPKSIAACDPTRWHAFPVRGGYDIRGRMLDAGERHLIARHIEAEARDIRNERLRLMHLQLISLLETSEEREQVEVNHVYAALAR